MIMKGLAAETVVKLLILVLAIVVLVLFFPTIYNGIIKFFSMLADWIIKLIRSIICSIPIINIIGKIGFC